MSRKKKTHKKVSHKVIIIGAGRLGTALGIALQKKGYDIIACVSRDIKHAKKSAKLINKKTAGFSSNNLSSLPSSDIIFIATPDDMIMQVAKQLAENISSANKPQYVFHTSGALSSEILESLKQNDIATGSLHPLISISDSKIGAESLSKAFFCIEGDVKAVKRGQRIVKDLGGKSFSIETTDKVLYHASAVMACGHFVALFDIAVEMLERCGLKSKEAKEALLPLVQSTVENLFVSENSKALTGTYARADFMTAEKHLNAIESANFEEALNTYILLGLRSIKLARQNGKDENALDRIKELLTRKENNVKRDRG